MNKTYETPKTKLSKHNLNFQYSNIHSTKVKLYLMAFQAGGVGTCVQLKVK